MWDTQQGHILAQPLSSSVIWGRHMTSCALVSSLVRCPEPRVGVLVAVEAQLSAG